MTGPSAPMPSTPTGTLVPGAPAANGGPATGTQNTAAGDPAAAAARGTSAAPATSSDPGAAANGPPGSATGPPAPFASVLEDQVARTALAEGQKETGDIPTPRRSTLAPSQPNAGAEATNSPADLAGVIASLTAVVRQVLAPTPRGANGVTDSDADGRPGDSRTRGRPGDNRRRRPARRQPPPTGGQATTAPPAGQATTAPTGGAATGGQAAPGPGPAPAHASVATASSVSTSPATTAAGTQPATAAPAANAAAAADAPTAVAAASTSTTPTTPTANPDRHDGVAADGVPLRLGSFEPHAEPRADGGRRPDPGTLRADAATDDRLAAAADAGHGVDHDTRPGHADLRGTHASRDRDRDRDDA